MRNFTGLTLFAISMMIIACSPGRQTSGLTIHNEKLNGRSFQKIFILTATMDIQVRNKLEQELADMAHDKGYAAVKSLDMIPFSFETMKLPTREEIETKVRESGCDAILVLSLSKIEGAVTYTPGIEIKANDQMLGGILAEVLNKDKVNPNRYTQPLPGKSVSGHFEKGKANFIITGNLCDAVTEEVLCTVPGQNIDLSALEEQSKTYAGSLISQLEKEKLLRKK